jgi:hypothetical protein
MTDNRYGFLGGENHLRLIIGAEDFWQDDVQGTYGFRFHSHRVGIVHVTFQTWELASYPCVKTELKINRYCRMAFFEAEVMTDYNKTKWFDLTGTRLDLL